MKKSTTTCFADGHSGGHIIPCLTLAKQLKKSHNARVLFFTSTKELDHSIIKESAIPDVHIQLPITQKRSLLYLPFFALSLFWSFIASFIQLLVYMPDRIISTGSSIALPVCFAGYLLRIPIELYELNAKPGKTVAVLSYIADTMHICFKTTSSYLSHNRLIQTPYPIRFHSNDRSAKKLLPSFDAKRTTLFIQGGSQGSHGINSAMKELVMKHSKIHQQIQIIHQTGKNRKEWQELYQKHAIPAHVFSYDHNVAPYYQAADMVICRSGAGALFETLFFNKQCLTMPLEIKSNNHQLFNAQAMQAEHSELFQVVRTPEQLMEKILYLIIS